MKRTSMEDIGQRYAPMISQFADIWADCKAVCQQLRSLRVTSDEWDPGRGGGHFWFDVTAPAVLEDFIVDAVGDDEDGAMIDIILHSVEGLLNWGEWVRVPTGQRVLRWPPPSVRPHTNRSLLSPRSESGPLSGETLN